MSSTVVHDQHKESFAKTALNTVNHYRGRGQYEYQQIYPIIDSAPILHVAFQSSPDMDDFGFPVILPMLGCTGKLDFSSTAQPDHEEDGRRPIYLHGYVSSRIMRLSRKATDTGASPAGIPICVSATLLDGIVLALTPNHHSCNYRSAVVFGHAHVVEDEAERLYAMELITNNLVPQRWAHTRYPNKTELKSTGILRIDIQSASTKVRTGTTGEAKDDLKNGETRKEVWAGVVPCKTIYGEPIPAPMNTFPGTPGYLTEWIGKHNEAEEEYAVETSQ